jgi:uncharacterized protein DUF11
MLNIHNFGSVAADDVQVAEPAPAGIVFASAQPQSGVSCIVQPALITCSRPGALSPGQSFQVNVIATATQPGTFTNAATVTAGGGGPEANLANNTASATTVVVAPGAPTATPPTTTPTPKPKAPAKPPRTPTPDVCTTMVVVQKVIAVERRGPLSIRSFAAGKPVAALVRIHGPGIDKFVRTGKGGRVTTTIRPAKRGFVTVTLRSPKPCTGGLRVGVVGVFQPPVTG